MHKNTPDIENPQYIPCNRGNDCAHHNAPELTADDYYPDYRYEDRISQPCKACKAAGQKKRDWRKYHDRSSVNNSGELLVIKKLRSLGIYAAPGKSSEWKWVDVVAWGCVRIEVKTSHLIDDKYQFTMNQKTPVKERADLVIFVCLDDEISYHVFPSTHGVFYHASGKHKKGLAYYLSGQRRGNTITLDHELMTQYMDRWEQVETRRIEIQQSLLANGQEPEYVGKQPAKMKPKELRNNQPKLF